MHLRYLLVIFFFIVYRNEVTTEQEDKINVPLCGYSVFRTRSFGREYLFLKKGIDWIILHDSVNKTKGAYNTALDMLEQHTDIKINDIHEVKNFSKITQSETIPKGESVKYWFAEVKNPEIQVNMSNKYNRKRWETLGSIQNFASKEVIDTIRTIEKHLQDTKYISHLLKE